MANYHPADELLMQFAAGQLTNALGVMVACHLESCPHCAHQVKVYNHLGGELLAEQSEAPVSAELLEHAWAKAQAPETPNPFANEGDARVPRPLRRFVPGYYDDVPWGGFSKSIQQWDLPISDSQYTARFYKIAAGKELPEHTHKGNEFTLVMTGSFSDKSGDYHAGDFILADEQTRHQPRAHMSEDCICFAVMDAPLKLTGFFGRMLNPFLR